MRLRGQLVVAFLLLAIAPLTAVIGYSYYTWEKTYKASNEAEAADLAARMGSRMEPLTGELTRRIGRIRGRHNPSRSPEHEQARLRALAEAERAESRQILLGVLAHRCAEPGSLGQEGAVELSRQR